MNGRFPIALHIMTLLTASKEIQSSDYLAGSINVNPVLVRKELGNLIKKKLVQSHAGKNGGYALAKPADQITLSEIYNSVKHGTILGKAKNTPNPACSIGQQINRHLDDLYVDVDKALMQKLDHTSLAEFCDRFQ